MEWSGAEWDWERGLAWVKSGYGSNDVEFIVDKEGHRLSRVAEYELTSGFFKYIDTDFNSPE